MNLDLINIPLVCGDKRFSITIQKENPTVDSWWWAHGTGYVNPAESHMGWGQTPQEAVLDFIANLDHDPCKYYQRQEDPNNPGHEINIEVYPGHNRNL